MHIKFIVTKAREIDHKPQNSRTDGYNRFGANQAGEAVTTAT